MRNTWIIVGVVVLLLAVGGVIFIQGSQNKLPEPSSSSDTLNQAQPSESAALEESARVPAGTQSGTTTTGATKEFTIDGQNFKFTPNKITVSKGDKVKITFKNLGGFHDFTIPDLDVSTKQIGTNQSEVVEFMATKAGSFEFFCSVGNHRAQGMKGMLVVE